MLILSEHSMSSKWVRKEIIKATEKEERQHRCVLFPLSLVPFQAVRAWTLPDGDTGEDLARRIREYFIPDFTEWRNHDRYAHSFERLLRDLKAEERGVR